ncbi:MAG TPA: tetratricopeptide repeat protein [Saprospiraceae bacterium]|nr:tetratricopeptide repeat protein [Saprospiraceae bacterium]
MKHTALIYFVLIGLLTACSGGGQNGKKQLISQLERSGSNLDRDSIQSLKKATMSYLEEEEITEEDKSKALYHFGLMLDRNRKFNDAAIAMKNLVIEYPKSAYVEDALYSLINIYKVKLRSPKVSAVLSDYLISINPEHEKKEELDGNIPDDYKGADDVLLNLREASLVQQEDGNVRVDRKNAKNLIFLSQMYANFRPEGENAKEHLHNAAEFARSIADNEELLNILNVLIDEYPDSKQGQEALFLKAFYYENNLKDEEGARALYEKFIEKYPENDFADDAEFLLKNIGKSEEEILREFEERQKEQQ